MCLVECGDVLAISYYCGKSSLNLTSMIRTLLLSAFLFCAITSFAQVGIGTTTPDPSAQLDIVSTNKGLLFPRVASTADVISPTKGLVVYQISGSEGLYVYDGGSWQRLVVTSGVPSATYATGYNSDTRSYYSSNSFDTFSNVQLSGFLMPNSSTFSPINAGTYLISYRVNLGPGALIAVQVNVDGGILPGSYFQKVGTIPFIAIDAIGELTPSSQVKLQYVCGGPTQISYASITFTRLK